MGQRKEWHSRQYAMLSGKHVTLCSLTCHENLGCCCICLLICCLLCVPTLVYSATWAPLQHKSTSSLQGPSPVLCGAVCAALQCVPQLTIHPGPVSLIRTYNMRVWTSGGTDVGCSLIEWSIFGEFRTEVDITDSGERCMLGCSIRWPHMHAWSMPCFVVSFCHLAELA